MALSVIEVEELRSYLKGVMDRADHHAGQVNEIALALTGAILWRSNDNESIKVMLREGETTNVLWVKIGSERYAFSYVHSTQEIEMRKSSLSGPTIHKFTNATPLTDIYSIFKAL
jgi:hypothetical protein